MALFYLRSLRVIEYNPDTGLIVDVRAASYITPENLPPAMFPTTRGNEVIYFYPLPVEDFNAQYLIGGVYVSPSTHYVNLDTNGLTPISTDIRKKIFTEFVLNKTILMGDDTDELTVDIPGLTDTPDALHASDIYMMVLQHTYVNAAGAPSTYNDQQGDSYYSRFEQIFIVPGERITVTFPAAGSFSVKLFSLRYHGTRNISYNQFRCSRRAYSSGKSSRALRKFQLLRSLKT